MKKILTVLTALFCAFALPAADLTVRYVQFIDIGKKIIELRMFFGHQLYFVAQLTVAARNENILHIILYLFKV